jgi:hypothetical protein
MTLVFKDPPTQGKRVRYDWDAIYAALRDNPGEWALLKEGGTISTYNAVTQNRIKNFNPTMGVEMRTANNNFKVKPRTCDIYVRFNPDLDESLTVKEREKMWIAYRKSQKEKKS